MSSTSSTTPNQPQPADDSAAAAATLPVNAGGEIITVLVIVLFLLFLIALVLYLRTKHCPGTIGSYSRRPGLSFASPPGLLLRRRPLELSVLNSLPVVTFDVRFENSELGLECAVCLSEFNGGEKARFLPNCNHGFHVECVDMWFASNSTCPLCRLPVEDVPHVLAISSDEAGSSSTACSSPDQKQEEKGMIVIDIYAGAGGVFADVGAASYRD